MQSYNSRRLSLILLISSLSLVLVATLVGMGMMSSVAAAQSPGAQPAPGVTRPGATAAPLELSDAVAPTAVAGLIPGGSFEEPGVWTEEINDTSCNLPSKLGDWSSVFTETVAYDGNQTLWVGGICLSDPPVPLVNSASQIVTVPPDQPVLSVWYHAERGDPDSAQPDDFAYIEIDQERWWELPLTRANNSDGWVKLTFDLDAYAGQDVSLKLGNETFNADTYVGNVLFDYITFQDPPPTIANIDPETGGSLTYTDDFGFSTIVEVPSNAVSQTTRLSYTPRNEPGFPLPPELIFANRAFDLDASENLLFLPVIQGSQASTAQVPARLDPAALAPTAPSQSFTFLRPVTITVEYSDDDVVGIDEGTLRLYYYDEAEGMWDDILFTCPDPGQYTSNPEQNYIQVQACHLSRMGMIGR